jgi:type VI secretion system secreted protein VgrG
MLAGATQKNRVAELTTPLGTDQLLLTSFTANEELSSPFEIRIEAECEEGNIDFNPALGRNCCVRLKTQADKTRYFSGVLVEAGWIGARQHRQQYELVLRPWLWLLTHAFDNRIFQKMTVIEIIEKVFTDAGFRDFKNETKETYPKIEYCVQYRESHFAFVSRLMERFGIYYFFEHGADKHVLVLADAKASHKPVPDLPKCRYVDTGERLHVTEETLSTWRSSRAFRTGKVTVNAFDFDKPAANLLHDQTEPGGYRHDGLERYDFAEKYKQGQESDLGQKFALAMLLSVQGQDQRRSAQGDAPSLFPGGLFQLEKHPNAKENKEYLVVAASHSFVGEAYESGYGSGEKNSYSGQYLLQLSERPFKAPLLTPRPTMSGPQTATVVGPPGEEIHCDKHGRIKVQFHWDREGKRDDKSSRWVRVAQVWAGKAWGGIVLPRIGMEVVVDFIEGDPDRPLVVGAVYNGSNTVPYGLPANKTQSGFKTRSSKSGGEENYNELLFEDKKDSEFVRLWAEKDLEVTVEDKETRTVKGKNKSLGTAARETTIEQGDDVENVKSGNQKVDVSNDQTTKVGQNVLIEAGASITLKCHGSKIVMKPGTIEIETASLSIKTTLTKVEATTLLEQKSAMITLN